MLALQSLPASPSNSDSNSDSNGDSNGNHSNPSFHTLPAELLLDILPHIPFTPQALSGIRRTNSRLNKLITGHEHALVKDIKRIQFSPTSLRLFPSLHTNTFSGLSTLHDRLSTLDDLHSQWLRICSHSPELDWLKGRWETVHKIGLLLLYRLQDTASYPDKVALINALPATSLVCLLFKLISSIKILRIHGPCPINAHHAAGDIMQRSDIELALEEMLLQHGPDFFLALLHPTSHPKSPWAISYATPPFPPIHLSIQTKTNLPPPLLLHSSLTSEISCMLTRQNAHPPQPRTLTSCLRRALAARLDCHFSQNTAQMWQILSSTAFDDVGEEKVIQVVRGEVIERGMKRIF
ncbi:Hypothetical predicted protein [Lecanosticta acicola]|uniref:F-box domain-containing protein n=1 Tax=Lecanosticta acicola TaxID=111012 RepID=A0AAI8Z231_9PEZI|nr:Hypothetical predicted protein [Lecanosticta acicola]